MAVAVALRDVHIQRQILLTHYLRRRGPQTPAVEVVERLLDVTVRVPPVAVVLSLFHTYLVLH